MHERPGKRQSQAYGEKKAEQLYEKCLIKRALEQQRCKEENKKKQKAQMAQCTFRPIIHSKRDRKPQSVRYINLSNPVKSGGLTMENRLMQFALQKESRLTKQRRDKQEHELDGCSFKPSTTPKSTRIVDEKGYAAITKPNMKIFQDKYRIRRRAERKSFESRPKDKFAQLYSASMERLDRRNLYASCLDKDCTFKPQLVSNWNGNMTVGSSIFGRFVPKTQN